MRCRAAGVVEINRQIGERRLLSLQRQPASQQRASFVTLRGCEGVIILLFAVGSSTADRTSGGFENLRVGDGEQTFRWVVCAITELRRVIKRVAGTDYLEKVRAVGRSIGASV